MSTPSEIADIADRHRGLVLALNMTWTLILHPSLPLAQIYAPVACGGQHGEDVPCYVRDAADDPDPIVTSSYETYRTAAAAAQGMPTAKVRVLSIAMGAAVTHLRDEIEKSGLHRFEDPLLEFLRHLRNASAHGDEWYFKGEEPRNEAHFGGLTLTKDLHGQSTLHTFGPKSALLLLEAIREHFRNIAQVEGGQTS